MGFMDRIRHLAFGHYFGDAGIQRAYERQPDGSMGESGMVVHMRCLRTGCTEYRKRKVSARPSSPPIVSLPRRQE